MSMTAEQRRRKAQMLAIPEIAQAYRNDPRTALASSMMGANDGSAVAGGKYAVADGIARMVQGLAGAYMQKQNLERGMQDQDQLVSDRATTGRDGLTGLAREAAGALGTPAPQPPVNAPQQPPAGQIPAVQPPASMTLAAQGGPEGGMPPFFQRASATRSPSRSAPDYNSYKSSAYDALEAKYEQQYGLPQGILSRIRTRGERSNADQVSPAGARTVYQFIPSTRAAFKKKYGVDAYAGPEQAAHAAALHLKESLERNNGDANLAIREYHGGPDRSRWGKHNQAYVERAGYGDTSRVGGYGSMSPVEQEPEIPPELERPDRPKAVGPTQSDKLRAAYEMMVAGNPYDSNRAMDMYGEGLTEQSRFKENATEREQALINSEYASDMGAFQDDRRSRVDDALTGRREVKSRNFNRQERIAGQDFSSGEAQKERNFQATQAAEERRFRSSERAKAELHDFALKDKDLELLGAEAAQKSYDRRNSFFSTKAGADMFTKTTEQLSTLNGVESALTELDGMLAKTKTGGLVRGNIPGWSRWADQNQQAFEALSSELALGKVSAMKGALSDKDREFVVGMVPNISKGKRANRTQIRFMLRATRRMKDYQKYMLKAQADGAQVDFVFNWDKYTKEVPLGANITYDQYVNGSRYDRKGNRITR